MADIKSFSEQVIANLEKVIVGKQQSIELIVILYFMLLSAGGETTSCFRIPTIPFWGLLSAISWQVVGRWLVSIGRKRVFYSGV